MARRPATIINNDADVAPTPAEMGLQDRMGLEGDEGNTAPAEAPEQDLADRIHMGRVANIAWHREQGDGHRYILKVFMPELRREISVFCTVPFVVEKNDNLEIVGDIVTAPDNRGQMAQKIEAELVSQKMEFTANSIRKWLEKHITNVGPATAARIVETLGGSRAVDKFKSMEAMLSAGIQEAIAKDIFTAYADNEVAIRNYMFLTSLTKDNKQILDKQQIRNIQERFKGRGGILQDIIKANPWVLMDIPSIGFKTADLVGLSLGFDFDSTQRIHAGCVYALNEVSRSNGHTAIPKDMMVETASSEEVLGVSPERIEGMIEEMLEDDIIIKDASNYLYSPEMWEAEEKIADKILNILSKKPYMEKEAAYALTDKVARFEGFVLDPSQREAVCKGLMYPALSLTGGPGTGKSTVQKVLCRALCMPESNRDERYKMEAMEPKYAALGLGDANAEEEYNIITASCPTGKGAVRLTEASGFPARTVHGTLEYSRKTDGPSRNERNPINSPCHLVDEATMLATNLAASYMKAIPDISGIILAGDVQQLSSVEAGQVYKDIIMSGIMPTSVLNTTHRQSKKSGIPIVSSRIMEGVFPFKEEEELRGCSHVNVDDNMSMGEVLKIISDDLLKQGLSPDTDIMIMCPQKNGDLGVVKVNETIKNFINPETDDEQTQEFKLGKQRKSSKRGNPEKENNDALPTLRLTLNDLVMNLENNMNIGVMNGEIGSVKGYTKVPEYNDDMEPTGVMLPAPIVEFNGKTIIFPPKDLKNLGLNNACTVHKNQGSENTVAVVILSNASARMCSKNLLFTGLTRGKGHSYIVGSSEALMKSINNIEPVIRFTGLKDKLVARIPKLIENLEKIGAPTDYLEENLSIIEDMKRKEEAAIAQAKLGLKAPEWSVKKTRRRVMPRAASSSRPVVRRTGVSGPTGANAGVRQPVGRPMVQRPVVSRPLANTRPQGVPARTVIPVRGTPSANTAETTPAAPAQARPIVQSPVRPVVSRPITQRPVAARPVMPRPPLNRTTPNQPQQNDTNRSEPNENNIPRAAPPARRVTPTQRVAPASPQSQRIESVPTPPAPPSAPVSREASEVNPVGRTPPIVRRPVVRNLVVRPKPPGI